jgi:soluble lytic murein transglycosylase-like protein
VTINDYRNICPCQQHAARKVWRRPLRFAARAAAVLVSIPITFAALDLPISAMNISLPDLRSANVAAFAKATLAKAASSKTEVRQQDLPIFTTPAMREQFLAPNLRIVTLDVFKEEYFRLHVPYGAIIYREARRNDLPPELVAAMVHTESDFRPRLVSHKSAQGLMQIVPDTARLLGIADPFNPEENIAAGTKYFRYLLNRFENEAVALAAYNAGEGNVERCRCIPPFQETRDYIARVNRRTDRYRQSVHTTYLTSMRLEMAMR